jgi:Micrococcal nuclease (thermonuclease) homologs
MENGALASIFTLTFLLSIICLIAGLIKPALFSRFSGNAVSKRKTIALVTFGVILISFMGVVIFAPPATVQDNSALTSSVQQPREDDANEIVVGQGDAKSEEHEATVIPASEVKNNSTQPQQEIIPTDDLFSITSVVDGDTFKADISGAVQTIRVIGIDTPETVDPRKPVECFGVEASNKAKAVLSGQKVRLEYDPTQGELDKYGRSLRHVFLQDGTNFGLLMIKDGYAHEYTYAVPYKYQSEFKAAQKQAMEKKAGLWGDICQSATAVETPNTSLAPAQSDGSGNCLIKGNISSKGEKIYHVIGCQSYNQTVIDESKGEKWFCTEQEALAAGWRKALNCD